MEAGGGTELVAVLTGIAGLIAALLGLLKYFNYRSKKDRMAAVGAAFEAVVESLAADDQVQRMAAAIRLRRFFDPRAELATGGFGRRLRQLAASTLRRLAPFTFTEKNEVDEGSDPDEDLQLDEGTKAADAAASAPSQADKARMRASEELPYAPDALRVIVAILRSQPPGNFQKLLADALTRAPKEFLDGADLQRANLQNAWLGRIDLPRADFFRADLSNASFREARAGGAQFYEARLARTRFTSAGLIKANFFGADLTRADFTKARLVGASFQEARARRATFRDADLKQAEFVRSDVREADFRGADLSGATFDGARLTGALFAAASNVPQSIARRLGPDSIHPTDVEHGPAPRIFLSQPAVLTPQQEALIDRIARLIEDGGAEPVRLFREDYPASGSLGEIRRLMSGCSGVAIVGLTQLVITEGALRPGTPEAAQVRDLSLATPWNEIEAGMAFALDLPMLVVHEHVGDAGVFGIRNDSALVLLDIREAGEPAALEEAVASWLRTLSSFAEAPRPLADESRA